MRATSLAVRVLVVTAGLGLVAGCTATGGTNPPETPGGTQPATATPAVTVVNATDELDDITCTRGDDGWSFDGKVRNKGKQAMTYTVTVRIAPKSNEKSTIGLTTITKQVPGGESVDFLAKNFSKLEKKGNVCIPIATKA